MAAALVAAPAEGGSSRPGREDIQVDATSRVEERKLEGAREFTQLVFQTRVAGQLHAMK